MRLPRSTLLSVLYPFLRVSSAPTDIPSAASFYVHHLPSLSESTPSKLTLYAGHISSDPSASSSTAITAHLFFVLVRARRVADKERVLFWFNGGPGCSSFDGLMMEVGPWRVDGQGGLKTVDGGWEEYTHIVYVDQPAGTGFSYASTDHYVHELSEASTQVIEFMQNFYDVFPEFEHMDTYLGGESYAGQYIPYFADAILSSTLPTPLKGLAIGNGWIDGRRQYPAYLDYAVQHGLVEEGSEDWKRGKKATDECQAELDKIEGEPINVDVCEGAMNAVLEGRTRDVDGTKKCTNVYDVRLDDEWPACGMNWPPDLADVTTYLGRDDVKKALHATAASQSWTECRGRVSSELHNKLSPSSITLLPSLLERGVPVLLFAGDRDFICNYVGIESMIQAMEWGGGKGLGKVQTQGWKVGGAPAGTWVSARNLTYAKIFNASHMVGFDVPHVSHDMILRFMDVNFSAILEGSARIPSSVGEDAKPSFLEQADEVGGGEGAKEGGTGKSPEQDKAMWEAYYNAGSAALVLVLIMLAIGIFVWCRVRRRQRSVRLEQNGETGTEEESIPLTMSRDEEGYRQRKGKERASDGEEENGVGNGERHKVGEEQAIFDVGSDDEEK